MHKHPTFRQNLEAIKKHGCIEIPAENGSLASGLEGVGRMAEPETLFSISAATLTENGPWTGKEVLINAGPNHEAIDPVRFIGNHSSGKMGIALAEAAADLGAEVNLILGPSSQRIVHPRIHVETCKTAQEMLLLCVQKWKTADIGFLTAAVADFRPKNHLKQKLKKTDKTELVLELEPTTDILKTLGTSKNKKQNRYISKSTQHNSYILFSLFLFKINVISVPFFGSETISNSAFISSALLFIFTKPLPNCISAFCKSISNKRINTLCQGKNITLLWATLVTSY